MTDWYEESIEPGIREEVRLLRDNGFNTVSSCEHRMEIDLDLPCDGSLQRLHDILFNAGHRNYEITATLCPGRIGATVRILGGVAERSNAPALKAGDPQGSESSNLSPSANLYRPEINRALLEVAKHNPVVLSLLYDTNLLPEQLASQEQMTIGLFAAYNRLEGVLLAFKYLQMLCGSFLAPSPADGGRG